MLVTDYTTKIKEICDTLGSINVMVDEDEMVQICLGGLAQRYGPIRTTVCTREKPPSFVDLQSMMMVEGNHVSGSKTTQLDSRMYTETDRPMGVEDEVVRHAIAAANKSRIKGMEIVPRVVPRVVRDPPRVGGVKAASETKTKCWYCGKKGHRESECWKKRTDSNKSGSRKTRKGQPS